ncbi:MAG: hypothetical protein KY432_06105 [Acidobacteria bacterium]|nr:hypothetical protein [Acidobacteriota bacterium]
MIDLHHHCLPGIDDGPEEWDQAVEQCKAALAEGVHTIVATPHVHREPWINADPRVLRDLVSELNRRIDGAPRILPGCEYFFAHDVVKQLSPSGSIIGLAESRYFLAEFSSSMIPPGLDRILFEIGLAGHVPIIAHPERNRGVQVNPDVLVDLIGRGAKIQITAGSLVARFGERAESTAFHLLDRQMVHFVSTDTHNLDRRPPMAAAAIEVLRERYGEERATALTEGNPLAVIENRDLVYDPEPRGSRKSNMWSILKSWIVQ